MFFVGVIFLGFCGGTMVGVGGGLFINYVTRYTF